MLVYQGHLQPRYVLHEMEMYEMGLLLHYLYLATKDSWEQARLMGYISAQTHSTKKMSITDIIAFPWEGDTATHDTSMSNDEKHRLEQKAKELEKLMNHGH